MTKTKKQIGIQDHNHWNKKSDYGGSHSAQSVLKKKKGKELVGATDCGTGSCNCGGGCNGECATSCEN